MSVGFHLQIGEPHLNPPTNMQLMLIELRSGMMLFFKHFGSPHWLVLTPCSVHLHFIKDIPIVGYGVLILLVHGN
jgi:hypothetical protein